MSGETASGDPLQLDTQARERALDVHRSLLLQAPAGSGKTTVLTARFLALLAVVEAPEEILAITFTRKAAAEMRHRVLGALQAAQSGGEMRGIPNRLLEQVHARDQERGWQLRRNVARLRIETIDALSYRLASALPIASRSTPDLQITTNAAPLYRRAARAALRGALAQPDAAAPVRWLLDRLDNQWTRLEQLVAQMLERRSHWLPRVLRAHEAGLARRVADSLHSLLRAQLTELTASVPLDARREAEQCLMLLGPGDSPRLDADPAHLEHWRALARLTITLKGEWRQRVTVPRDTVLADAREFRRLVQDWIARQSARPAVLAALREALTLPTAHLSPEDEAAIAALATILTRAVAELHLEFAQSRRVDYAYVAAAARQALHEQGGPSDLALRAGEQIRHILLDEFQDTSYDQFDLLQALTAGWEPGDGRTLFIVGDPMQSIYQFREAEVGLFLRARDRGLGNLALESLQLRRNYRSSDALIRWTNAQFSRVFPPQDDPRLAAVRYLSAVAGTPEGAPSEHPAVRLRRIAGHEEGAEAECVLGIVREERRRDPQGSIAVLVAAREHAAAIVARLRQAGFALRGVDLEPLRDRPVVRDLSALARILLHAGDRTAWLGMLRAPWCGLELAALERFFRDADADLFRALEQWAGANEQRAVQHLCRALEPALRGAERGWPLWERVERSWLRLAGPAAYPEEADRLDAERFIDALFAHENPEALVGDGMADLTEHIYSVAPPQAGAVEVMTIHAAKGLEWDTVILPGLEKRGAIDRDPLLHWIDLPRPGEGSDLLLAPIRATEEAQEGLLAAYIKRLRRTRLDLERVRQLYVAVTRARRSLHLLAALSESANTGELQPPRSGSLLACLWDAIAEDFCAAESLYAGPAAPPVERPTPMLARLPPDWLPPVPPTPPQVQRLRLGAEAQADAPEYSWVGLMARAVGTIVHGELRRLSLLPDLPEPGSLPAREHYYRGWLAELGVPRAEHARAQQMILEALARTLADERGRWLLSGGHTRAVSEWRLTGVHEGRVVNVVFDRMIIDSRGDRWIVDYKTSRHEGGALERFIEQEAERYAPQLRRYAALAAELGPQPVRTALYFPLLGVFRELSAQPLSSPDQ